MTRVKHEYIVPLKKQMLLLRSRSLLATCCLANSLPPPGGHTTLDLARTSPDMLKKLGNLWREIEGAVFSKESFLVPFLGFYGCLMVMVTQIFFCRGPCLHPHSVKLETGRLGGEAEEPLGQQEPPLPPPIPTNIDFFKRCWEIYFRTGGVGRR